MNDIEIIKNSIEELKKMAGDDEAAHSFEDRLREAVLQDIADGKPNAQELASEVLKTSEVEFNRWCA